MWYDNTEVEASLLRDYGKAISNTVAFLFLRCSKNITSKIKFGGSSVPILFRWITGWLKTCRLFTHYLFQCEFKKISVPVLVGNKYWSGLLKDYYGPRAAIYFNFLARSLENGHGFQLKDWRREWIKLTNNWQKSRKIFPVESNGNALNISRWLYYKYLGNRDTYDH